MTNVQENKDCSKGTVEEVVKAPLSIVQSKSEKEIMKELHAPFDSEEIEWRVIRHQMTAQGLKVIVCAYVTARAVQQRLDEVFGVFGWKNEFLQWGQGATLAGISVLWNGEWITKWDGADNTSIESTKGGLSAAQKRAAVQFGIGRILYDIPEQWVPIVENKTDTATNFFQKEINGTKYKGYWANPELPDWATSKDGKKTKAQEEQNQLAAKQRQQKDDLVSKIESFKNLIGFKDNSSPVKIFNKVNNRDFTSLNDIVKNASLEELTNLSNELEPVAKLKNFSDTYGIELEFVLSMVHLIRPDLNKKRTLTSLVTLFKDEDAIQVEQTLIAEKQNRDRDAQSA